MNNEAIMTEKKNFWEKLKAFLGLAEQSNDVSLISANDAYLKATYNMIEDQETRFNHFIKSLNSLIKLKSETNHYCCATEIPKELTEDYLDKIIETYRNLGYKVVDMNDAIENLERKFIFIAWSNCDNLK